MNIGDLVWLDGLMRMDTAEATGIALAAVVESMVPAHREDGEVVDHEYIVRVVLTNVAVRCRRHALSGRRPL